MSSFLNTHSKTELEANMNRRDLIGRTLGAVVVAITSGRGVAGNAFTLPDPLCDNEYCKNFLESTARENIKETGDWKRSIWRDRADKKMLLTFYGCCGCEVSLRNDPDLSSSWTYTRRNLTPNERDSFQRKYGHLLLHQYIAPGIRIRGFILNGRIPGWNLSSARRG